MFDRVLNVLLLTGRYNTLPPPSCRRRFKLCLSVLLSNLIVLVWWDVSDVLVDGRFIKKIHQYGGEGIRSVDEMERV